MLSRLVSRWRRPAPAGRHARGGPADRAGGTHDRAPGTPSAPVPEPPAPVPLDRSPAAYAPAGQSHPPGEPIAHGPVHLGFADGGELDLPEDDPRVSGFTAAAAEILQLRQVP